MLISVVCAAVLHSPNGTPEHGSDEVSDLGHDAAVMGHSIECEGEQTGSLYNVSCVPDISRWNRPTGLSLSLSLSL